METILENLQTPSAENEDRMVVVSGAEGEPAAVHHPNRLREMRENAPLTRKMLSQRCQLLAEKDSTLYVAVAVSTIRDLEVGARLPRPGTAGTIAAVLDVSVHELFPKLSRSINNPTGITGAGMNRGRPKRNLQAGRNIPRSSNGR